MSDKFVDVLIHIDEKTSEDKRESIRKTLLQTDGVEAAAYQNETPHLIMIEYDPNHVTSLKLLEKVKTHNVHAELVGL